MIKSLRRLPMAGALLVLAGVACNQPAFAQDPAPSQHIAVVNPSHILRNMQEMVDLRENEKTQIAKLRQQEQDRQKELQDMVERRDKFDKPDSDDYQKHSTEIMQKTLEDRNWADFQQAMISRDNKKHMLDMFGKIQNVVGKIAEEKKIDLVLADEGLDLTPEELDKLTSEQLNQYLQRHNVLYANKALDITEDTITRLNAAFKASGAAAPSTPAPAPSGK
jgi:Skp family chaperone for outer membrane proteins